MYKIRRKVVLHVGWPKTGTTTLQKHALNKVNGYRYVGKVPFTPGANKFLHDFVYLISYASLEKFTSSQAIMFERLLSQEHALFGNIDESKSIIISEESILSSLLKPSIHQHHGISTASLSQLVARLSELEKSWNISFDILISERDPFAMLHSYYVQCYHFIHHLPGLTSFGEYIQTGTSQLPGIDLGFGYLRPRLVVDAFRDCFGEDHVYHLHMNEIMGQKIIQLNRWYPDFSDVPLTEPTQENKRTLDKDVKIAHIRPSWGAKRKFKTVTFLKEVRNLYKRRYGNLKNLEVLVRAMPEDRSKLDAFIHN